MTDDLDALIEAVEEGEWFGDLPRPQVLLTDLCWKAFNGSLDAAKSLHDELLSGWTYAFGDDEKGAAGVVARDLQSEEIEAHSENPARAWLLAILKAYREQVTK